MSIIDILRETGANIVEKTDPCQAAKAIKNDTELAGAQAAHRRDGLALVRFMIWFASLAPGDVDEFGIAEKLLELRSMGDHFKGLSFPTIAGSGPNGAIVHYGASPESNRTFNDGELLLVDSGAQYLDGTTDVTRTFAIGTPSAEQIDRFTRVMQCHIGLGSAHFPIGTTGHQLDVLARRPLWEEGFNFAHGTGHGVGSYLGVHEGPHNISPRAGGVPLEPGMIVSNEPGYYKTGEYGIRCENLILVVPSDRVGDGDYLTFEPLTFAPFDRRLMDPSLFSAAELAWLDAYHQRVYNTHADDLTDTEQHWLKAATAPLIA
jgi:Xaa-Pro aminopeptidase